MQSFSTGERFLTRGVKDIFNRICLIECGRSNLIQLCFYRKFMIYLFVINPFHGCFTYNWILNAGNLNLLTRESRIPFLSVPRIAVHSLSFFLRFFFAFIFLSLCSGNDLYSQRNFICWFNFKKYFFKKRTIFRDKKYIYTNNFKEILLIPLPWLVIPLYCHKRN